MTQVTDYIYHMITSAEGSSCCKQAAVQTCGLACICIQLNLLDEGLSKATLNVFVILCENNTRYSAGRMRASERERETFELLLILILPPAAIALLLSVYKWVFLLNVVAAVPISVKLRIVCKALSQYHIKIRAQPSISLVSIVHADARRHMPASWYVPTYPHTCQA